jgi:hypothetical protein
LLAAVNPVSRTCSGERNRAASKPGPGPARVDGGRATYAIGARSRVWPASSTNNRSGSIFS